MLRFYHLTTLLFLILITNSYLFGIENEQLRLNEKTFCTTNATQNIKDDLAKGISSFLFEIEQNGNLFNFVSNSENKILSTELTSLKSYFSSKKSDNIKLLFTGNYNEKEFGIYLRNALGALCEIANSENIGTGNTETTDRAKIRCFLSNTLTELSDSIQVEKRYQGRFSNDPEGKMLLFEVAENNIDSLKSACIKIWISTGRIPNFILTTPETTANTQDAVNWLNKIRRFRGEIKYNGKILNEIFWKQMPGTVTPGRFSFPILDYSLVLSPYKNGHMLTPGEIIHHTGMEDVIRPFIAYDTDFKHGLIYHFNFEKNAKNEVAPSKVNSIVNGSKWIRDKDRGNVVLFDSINSYIDYSNPNQLNFNTPISVSMWLKPHQFKAFMGILGIGTSFSFKLKDGKLDFTTAQIQDHIDSTTLKLNQWTHVGFVFNPGSTIDFFVNGQKGKTMQASEIKDSQQSLVVGNNIWGEQYFGCIDELMIWDRGLSESEFEKLYIQQLEPDKAKTFWLLFLVPLMIFILFVLTKRKSRRAQTHKTNTAVDFKPGKPSCRNKNSVEVFGQFNVVSKESENITKSFSPLLKQLLSFFILKTVFSEHDGISTKEINDVFWPGFSKEQAKDNRGTNIKKLRNLLNQLPGIQIVFKDKKWFIELTGETTVDLYQYKALKNKINIELEEGVVNEESVQLLINLLNKGDILQDLEAEWLDSLKGKCTQEVTDLLSRIWESNTNNKSLNTEVAKTMLLFDNLNEDALTILIQNLIESGNHGLAKQAYQEFSKRFETLYSEKFSLEYNDIQKQKDA